MNVKVKKRSYNERVLEIEQGSFTPLVFSAMGGMGREAKTLYKRVCENISEKRNKDLAKVTSWVRRKLSFALINSLCMCIRGSRSIDNTSTQNLSMSIKNDPRISEASSDEKLNRKNL